MKAVVLAAGEGQRLRPLTFTRPKHMIQIGGKPLLEHLLVALREAGVKDVLIVVHYKAEQIKDYFRDGSRLRMNVDYLRQKEISGTANAFGLAESHMDDDFLAVYGDLLLTSNVIQSVIRHHNEKKPAATLTTLSVEHPEYYGIIKTEGNRVAEIVEKPSPEIAAGKPINAGLYVFSTEIFEAIGRTGASPRGEQEITDSIRLLIEDGKPVVAARLPREEWLDVGKPWDLLDANARVLTHVKPQVLGRVEKGARLGDPDDPHDSVFVGEGARIRSGAYIEGPAYIGEGSDIGPNCYIRPSTSIGRNVRIGNACEVKNSIIMDGAHIGHLSYVGDSVIGEGCNLGAGFISANLRFDHRTVEMRIKNEIVNSGRSKLGVIMGDNVKTGIGALFMPGVKVGCNSCIGPNLTVTRDIPSDTILFLKQQTERRSL